MFAIKRLARTSGAVAAAASLAVAGGAHASAEPAEADGELPVEWDLGAAIPKTLDATQPPPGAND